VAFLFPYVRHGRTDLCIRLWLKSFQSTKHGWTSPTVFQPSVQPNASPICSRPGLKSHSELPAQSALRQISYWPNLPVICKNWTALLKSNRRMSDVYWKECRLRSCEAEQLSLFRDVQKKSDAIRAMDMVNDRYGDFSVTYGSLLSAEAKGSHVISPAWRLEGIRNVEVK